MAFLRRFLVAEPPLYGVFSSSGRGASALAAATPGLRGPCRPRGCADGGGLGARGATRTPAPAPQPCWRGGGLLATGLAAPQGRRLQRGGWRSPPDPGLRRRDKERTTEVLREDHDGGFAAFSASGGPPRAPGTSKNGSGRKTGPGEVVGTSGGGVLNKTRRRVSGFPPLTADPPRFV